MANKKKQALDNLFETGRISQTTHDAFNNDIHAGIMEIEKQQDTLLAKMQNTTQELDGQVKILESLLTNYEIQHAVGEIEEDIYQSEIHLLSNGLETAKRELSKIKDAVSQLAPPVEPPTAETKIDSILQDNESVPLTATPLTEPERLIETSEELFVTPEPLTQEPCLTMDNSITEATEIEIINTAPQETPQIIDEAVQVADVVPEAVESELQIDEAVQVADVVPEAVESEFQVEQTNPFDEETKNETDEWPQFVDEPVQLDEGPEIIQHEPLFLNSINQTIDEVPQETIPKKSEESAIENLTEQQDQIEDSNTDSDEETTENTEQY